MRSERRAGHRRVDVRVREALQALGVSAARRPPEPLELLAAARWLQFPPATEALFRSDYARSSLASHRASLVLSIVLYSAFGLLDYWGLPSSPAAAWVIRFGFVGPFLTVALLLSFLTVFERIMQPVAASVILVTGGGIVAMIATARPEDPAFTHYYAGLILVVTFGCTFIRARTRLAAAASVTVIVAYEIVALGVQRILSVPNGMPMFLNANFFLWSSAILGVTTGYFQEYYLRRDFLQRRAILSELTAARQIQQALLEQEPIDIPGLDVAAECRTSLLVGGDYFGVLPAGGHRWLFAIADVSGKGAAAALLMANLHALMRTFPAEQGLADTAAAISAHVHRVMQQRRYITAILTCCDTTTGRLEYVNAGHRGGAVIDPAGRVETLEPSGLPLGLFAHGSWQVNTLTLRPGSRLVLYTDGIAERENEAGEHYEEGRLLAAIGGGPDEAAGLLESIFRDNDAFAGRKAPTDDATVVIVRVPSPTATSES